jgi:predicted RNA binding protein with dsRBD fold (UPF0201 family)
MSDELSLALENLSRERSKYNKKPTKVQAINVRRELLNLKKICDVERKTILKTVKDKPKKFYNRKQLVVVEPVAVESVVLEEPVMTDTKSNK